MKMNNQKLYAIRNPLIGMIKIGISKNPQQRCWQLQASAGTQLEVILTQAARAPRAAERYLHRELKAFRAYGEWFKLPREKLTELPQLFQVASSLVNKMEETIDAERVRIAESEPREYERGFEDGAMHAKSVMVKIIASSNVLNGRTANLPKVWEDLLNELGLEIVVQPKQVSKTGEAN
jgi:hypothetical protein